MAHDVFVSYAKGDQAVADAVREALEEAGIRCWIAPRDIVAGRHWSGAIIRAISASRIMVLVFSERANASVQILREVERASDSRVVIVPFRIEETVPTDDLAYFISAQHWLDAFTPPLEAHLRRLVSGVHGILEESGGRRAESPGDARPEETGGGGEGAATGETTGAPGPLPGALPEDPGEAGPASPPEAEVPIAPPVPGGAGDPGRRASAVPPALRKPILAVAGMSAFIAAVVLLPVRGRDAAEVGADRLPADLVAVAGGHRLAVDSAARLLAANPQIAPDSQVVRTLADYWIDYTLLADAAARDSTLATIDLGALARPARDEMRIGKLLGRMVRADTVFTGEELDRLWAANAPADEVRVRHIMLSLPSGATATQRDSVRGEAEELRRRALDGEDFARLAAEHSQDVTARSGGDLGYVSRGRMVKAFEDAAFRLQPGQIGPVTETAFGYHVIRVEERRALPMSEENVPPFRKRMAERARLEADSLYLDAAARDARLRIVAGAAAIMRETARRPESVREDRAAVREIATYDGGSYTARDFAEYLETLAPQVRSELSSADNARLEAAAWRLAIGRILLREAGAQRVELTEAEEDSLRKEVRRAVRSLLASTGLHRAGVRAPERQRAVMDLLRRAISGQEQLVAPGTLGMQLRDRFGARINESAFPGVIGAVARIRASAPGAPPSATSP